MKCLKCNADFEPKKGFLKYCSWKCRNGRTWTESDKLLKSTSAKKSEKVKLANQKICREKIKYLRIELTCKICGVLFTTYRKSSVACSHKCKLIGLANGMYKKSYENHGGYRKGSGRGKAGFYKGY